MYLERFLPEITFLLNRELLYSSSRLFNKWMLKKIKNSKNFFFTRGGKIGEICQLYKPVWTADFGEIDDSRNFFFIISTKNLSLSKERYLNDSIEFWEYSPNNGFIKTNISFLSNKGEIWSIKKKEIITKKKKGMLILLCGFMIRLIELPKYSSQINIIENESMLINLTNVFHWRLELSKKKIITGDLTGKITVLNLEKNFSWMQINHNISSFSPIGGIAILPIENDKKFRYLASGCFGGFLKIWDISDCSFPLKQFYFSKRWITDVNFLKPFWGNLIFLIALDNGFLSCLNFSFQEISNQVFCHQGGVWKFFSESNFLFTVGGDGYLNLLEINSPWFYQENTLGCLFPIFLYFFNNSKPKHFFNPFQSIDETFSIKELHPGFLPNTHLTFCSAENSGVILILKFFFN